GRLVTGPGDDVLQALERGEPGRVDETRADQHVLVGEREPRPAQLVADDRLEDLVALRRPLHRAEADQDARGATDALEGAEREATELAVLAGLRDEDPFLPLLGQE